MKKEGCFTIEGGSSSMGLFLMWKEDVAKSLIALSSIHIHMELEMGDEKFRFTGIHGFSKRQHKRETWQLLDHNRGASQLPWMIVEISMKFFTIMKKEWSSMIIF
ncbi:hypothetical protein V6N12_024342 [Hibiscus sabdariffa]|uniref:Uncharacterized protein n=1 Tax=Hibiscus sabdariffa TaxID=183260 RepID=A0ABR2G0D4_9ROSI